MSASGAAPAPTAPRPHLRVVFCTRGGYFGALVLARLSRCPEIELCGIVLSGRVLEARFGFVRGAVALIRRCGLRYALYLFCATTLAGALNVAALFKWSVPVLRTRDLNSTAGLQFLARTSPDLLVSAFFDQRLGPAALAVPTRGCVNVHPSLLPEFRGVDPVLQARLARAEALGVTVHWMTARLDEGSVLAQQPVSPPAQASLFACTATLFREGAELLARSLGRIAQRERGAAQRSGGSYQSWPSPAEVRALRALGIPLIRFVDLVRTWTGRG